MSAVSIADRADWLGDTDLQTLLALLARGGEEARIAGGAVRNTLMGAPVVDVDIATTVPPEETMRRVAEAGFRAVATGIEHGTVTVIAGGRPYEVTTLRHDVETDGRRARVVFGRDWRRDAERRDFTINALYAEADGTVIDLVGGMADIADRRLRFIGDADTRIREDYLRILRFFRFFAWYGTGRPDAEGLKACARLRGGLARLSAERVWAELKRLLAAPDPSRALLWMRQSGVLTAVVPETEKWGIDAIHGLVETERALGWPADPMLRLAAMVPPDAARMEALARRLKLSRDETARLTLWAMAVPPAHDLTEADLARLLYRSDHRAVVDRLRLGLSSARGGSPDLARTIGLARLLAFAERWDKPPLPVTGGDLKALGIAEGRGLGVALKALEDQWVESGFTLGRDALLARAATLAAS